MSNSLKSPLEAIYLTHIKEEKKVAWEKLLIGLSELVVTLGVFGAIAFIITVIGGTLLLFYMILCFGENAFKLLLPYIRETITIFLNETKKEHPAIRLESRLHSFLALLAILCLALIALHALIPWTNKHTEEIRGFFMWDFTLFVALTYVSIKLAIRL